jgi:hypothetical protein
MKVEFEPKEIELLVTELQSNISELRGLIASGMRKDLRDDIRKDKVTLMEILEKLEIAARTGGLVERAA